MRISLKRGQATIFVIIAIAIVGLLVVGFVFRDSLFGERIPEEFREIYTTYAACIEQEAETGISILESQGGRIDSGVYVPGSDYSPSSNQLYFAGVVMPYWYYITGNNIANENIPTKGEMETELATFIEDRINSNCDLQSYYEQGFYIDLEDAKASVRINDNNVKVDLTSAVVSEREDRSARKTKHSVGVESKLGSLYDAAKEVYATEAEQSFLENYALDTLRLSAPVDGSLIQCNPQVWKTREVVDGLKNDLQANLQAVRFKGDYYKLDSKEDEYFVVDRDVGEPVSFFYATDWPSKVEIYGGGVSQELMIAQPVGTQQGLGILGFCYVPYHYVYDVNFPVMAIVGDGLETFQFPMIVVIDKNVVKKSLVTESVIDESIDICKFMEGNADIKVMDNQYNPVEAEVSYKCFDSTCYLGTTTLESGGDLDAKIPSCVNGQIIVRAEGFADKKQLYSSNSESSAEVFLDRTYTLPVELNVGGKDVGSSSTALVSFVSDDGYSASVFYPDTKTITLKEGLYTINVYVYGNTNVVIPGTTKVECIESARSGLAGLFGATKEECFPIQVPETKLDSSLIGGGKTTTYILESELQKGTLHIDSGELAPATSLAQLQYNLEAFSGLGVQTTFT